MNTAKPILLVVDDEPDMADFVAIAGESTGYEVKVAHSGREFQQVYLGSNPALIVMDVAMPDMDAIQLLEWLGDAGNVVPVILMSGYGDHMLSWASTLGSEKGNTVIETLSKPIKLEILENTLSEYMKNIS